MIDRKGKRNEEAVAEGVAVVDVIWNMILMVPKHAKRNIKKQHKR
jgi:hypothetical protein